MKDSKLVDLTHPLSSDTPCWAGDCGYRIEIECDYTDCAGPDFFRTQKITTRAGMGTHIDAPAHCFSGTQTIDSLQLEDLVAACAVIRVDDIADENFIVMPEIVHRYESKHGRICESAFVVFHTGWSRYWDSPQTYQNNLAFPSVHETTAKLLLERGISGLGIDTLSPDARGLDFPVHRAVLGAGKYIVENVANADQLPASGSRVFVLPMKIKDGTEAPVRLIAEV